eukprot:428089-Prymnesium_polylepis.1
MAMGCARIAQARLSEIAAAEERGKLTAREEVAAWAEVHREEAVRGALEAAAERSEVAAEKMLRAMSLSLREEAPEAVQML